MRMIMAGLLVALAACGGDDGDGGDGPSLLGGDLIGRWRALPSATSPPPAPVGDRYTIAFAADGTLTEGTFDDPTPERGAYELDADGGHVTITRELSAAEPVTFPFHAGLDRLVLNALLPGGANEGLVGGWTGTWTFAGAELEAAVTLRRDATASVARYNPSAPQEVYDTTWRSVGDDVYVERGAVGGGPSPMTLTLIDHVLGGGFERVP
jgi:hypothetical protein